MYPPSLESPEQHDVNEPFVNHEDCVAELQQRENNKLSHVGHEDLVGDGGVDNLTELVTRVGHRADAAERERRRVCRSKVLLPLRPQLRVRTFPTDQLDSSTKTAM